MVWRCCECGTKHQYGSDCDRDCGHYRCPHCDEIIQTKVGLAQAEAAKAELSKQASTRYGQQVQGCFGCGRTNHTEERCFKLHPELRTQAREKCSGCGRPGHSPEQCYTLHPGLRHSFKFKKYDTKLTKEDDANTPTCDACGKAGHTREKCYKLHPELDPDRAEKSKPCPHCNQTGHIEENCWKAYPERAQPWAGDHLKYCTHCEKTGHPSEKCWYLNPEMAPEKLLWRKAQQAKKKEAEGAAKCANCDKWGHTEDDCWTKAPEKAPARIQKKLVMGKEESEDKARKTALGNFV